MEVGDGRLPARVVNDRVYVAVGKDVREGRSTLSWALNNFGGHFRIIHVHQPHQLNPSPHPFYGSGSRNPQELARQEMESILDEYIHMCSQAGVPAQKRHVEMQDIGKGIVELIEQHAITKLVMGAAADRRYFEGMAQLTSAKAKFVNQHAHPSCHIWFVCNGHVIYSREGDLSTFDMDITPSVLPGRSVVESGLQNTRSPSLDSIHSRSNSSEVEDDLALVQFEDPERSDKSSARSPVPAVHQPPSSVADDLALVQFEDPERSDESSARSPVPAVHQPPSSVADNLALVQFEDPERSDESSARSPVPAVHQPPSSVAEGINSEELCEQLDRAMSEVTKAKREALEELIRRQKAEKAAIEAKRKVGALENSHAEESIQRINLKEMLEKERERCKMIENERDDLQMLFENALKANEELSSHQAGEPSSLNSEDQEVITKFSFSEILEATENFNPSSKIEEGDYGST